MREKWTPITRNTKRLFTINFSRKHPSQLQKLNQKINKPDDDTKRDDEMRHVTENEET